MCTRNYELFLEDEACGYKETQSSIIEVVLYYWERMSNIQWPQREAAIAGYKMFFFLTVCLWGFDNSESGIMNEERVMLWFSKLDVIHGSC